MSWLLWCIAFAAPLPHVPVGEDRSVWADAWDHAGLHERGGLDVSVHLVDQGTERWVLEVRRSGQVVRSTTVARPLTAVDREEVAFLAAALLRDLETGDDATAAPLLTVAASAPPPAPPPASDTRLASTQATLPAAPTPPSPVVVTDAVPDAAPEEPEPVDTEPLPDPEPDLDEPSDDALADVAPDELPPDEPLDLVRTPAPEPPKARRPSPDGDRPRLGFAPLRFTVGVDAARREQAGPRVGLQLPLGRSGPWGVAVDTGFVAAHQAFDPVGTSTFQLETAGLVTLEGPWSFAQAGMGVAARTYRRDWRAVRTQFVPQATVLTGFRYGRAYLGVGQNIDLMQVQIRDNDQSLHPTAIVQWRILAGVRLGGKKRDPKSGSPTFPGQTEETP